MKSHTLLTLVATLVAAPNVLAEEEPWVPSSSTFSALRARALGPALMSGRIGDIAMNPHDPREFYLAVSSGNVWKTVNAGTTFTPVFERYGSYSIGCVAIDPSRTQTVWLGTGENNSQRSVAWGDGVYRSDDGGGSWKNVGLKDSEHIGMITIDPRDTDVVYVAAQGPLWRSGGDRGLYKTTDGGSSWERILHISDDTGVNEVHMDPRDPDTLYASAYQRRRHVWTLINGGPESAIYKSTDAGATWHKLTRGIPSVDKGRIGLEIAPSRPDTVYAIIEAAEGKGGVFRSTDGGETWTRRSSYMSSSPQYYNELVCDPKDPNRLYSLDTYLHVSDDGAATFSRVPNRNRHVDDHALWIDPEQTDHLIIGCDGGLYESWDRGQNWRFAANLPITQFYRVGIDNSEPFYFIYGGTQDNSTLGGPVRTTDRMGIANEHWFQTVGGDGFETQVHPDDPNIVFSQWQYGNLIRFDRRTGQRTDIKPRQRPGEAPYVFNWDSPLLISPHNADRLYFGGDRLFRSDDRGDSWVPVSPDLTRGIDRNELEVMGVRQRPDAVAKHMSTSIYGNSVALSESPLVEGLLYVGTDDGLLHVSDDGGEEWQRIETFPVVPDQTYVSAIIASRHAEDRVYIGFDNHKQGDFAPYILRSDDRGRTWRSIAGDLPDRDVVYTIAEDHVDPDLLFVGTEFGAYFTRDGGENWRRIAGVPTISVRDIEIQRRENDLVMATFGRGFYVLDNYTPIRAANAEMLEDEAAIFPVKTALRYVERSRLGGRGGKGSQGASFYAAANPTFGAVFTYHIKEKIKTSRELRREAEKGDDWVHPTPEELSAEEREQAPRLRIVVQTPDGEVVRRIPISRDAGIHRAAWDLRYPAMTPASGGSQPSGPLAAPGSYTALIEREVDGEIEALCEPVSFEVVSLDEMTGDPDEILAFQSDLIELQRAVMGAVRVAGEADQRLDACRNAIAAGAEVDQELLKTVNALEARLHGILVALRGDPAVRRRQVPTSPSIQERVSSAVWGSYSVTTPPTQTHRDGYAYAAEAFGPVLADLRSLIEEDLSNLEEQLEQAGAPWTPGRIPSWSPPE